MLREQLAFYNRLGVSQIDDDVDIGSLSNIRHLWQDSTQNIDLNKCFIELNRVVKKEAFYAAS